MKLSELINDPTALGLGASAVSSTDNLVSGGRGSVIGQGLSEGLSLASTGASIGGPVGGIIGGAVGLTKGLIEGGKRKKREEAIDLKEQRRKEDLFDQRSRSLIDLFPTTGIEGGGNIYAYGGKLRNSKLVLESVDIQKVGDGYLIKGHKHGDGGTKAITEDGKQIELELGEVLVDDKVFTTRLLPTQQFLNIIKETYYFDFFDTVSYAVVANEVLQKIDKFNTYKYLGSRGSIQTNILMIDRCYNVLDLLFVDQETTKAIKSQQNG